MEKIAPPAERPLPTRRARTAKLVRENGRLALPFIPPSVSRGRIVQHHHPTARCLATTKPYDSAPRNATFRLAEWVQCQDRKRLEDWSEDYGCCRPCRQTRLLRCMKSISQPAYPSRACCE